MSRNERKYLDIYFLEALDPTQIIILGKFASKHPIWSLTYDIKYINYMMLHRVLKRLIELFADPGHTCKLFVMVITCFTESLPLTQLHRSMSGRSQSGEISSKEWREPSLKVSLSVLGSGMKTETLACVSILPPNTKIYDLNLLNLGNFSYRMYLAVA